MSPEMPLTIVFLAPFGIRPKGTLIARMLPLAVALMQNGHRVEIIAPPYTNPEDSGLVEMHRGVRLTNICLSSLWKPLATLVMAWRMFRQSISFRPDVVHLFKPKGYGGLAVMLLILLRRSGLPMPRVVVDTDDWEGKGGMNELHAYSSLEKRVFAFQEGWLLPHASAVTVASRELEKMVGASGVDADRMLYLPNCVEDLPRGDGSPVRHSHGIPDNAPVVLLYTRFFEFNQEVLHTVMAEIHHRMPSVCFLIVGKGRNGEEQQLITAAERGGFGQSLQMAGWVEPSDLPNYLAAGDVAIYPFEDTLINRCKCPAKLTELLRTGVPVVADRVGQISEYIQHNVSGILCDSGNAVQMAMAVVALLRDLQQRQAIGAAAREHLTTHFSWESYANAVGHFYQRGR